MSLVADKKIVGDPENATLPLPEDKVMAFLYEYKSVQPPLTLVGRTRASHLCERFIGRARLPAP